MNKDINIKQKEEREAFEIYTHWTRIKMLQDQLVFVFLGILISVPLSLWLTDGLRLTVVVLFIATAYGVRLWLFLPMAQDEASYNFFKKVGSITLSDAKHLVYDEHLLVRLCTTKKTMLAFERLKTVSVKWSEEC